MADLEITALDNAELGHLEADSNRTTALFVFNHRVTRRKVFCLDADGAILHGVNEVDIDLDLKANLESGNDEALALGEEPRNSKMTAESLVEGCFYGFSSLYDTISVQILRHTRVGVVPQRGLCI